MNLTDAQKQKVTEWIQQGLKLSEIQSRIDSELGLRLTYMEVKFLLADLELRPKDQERPKAVPPLAAAQGSAGGASGGGQPSQTESAPPPMLSPEPELPAPPQSAPGGVQVSLDTVTRPGAVVSGRVTFSDGKSAEWYLDQYGRLGMAPGEKGYKPSQMDIMAFQTELQNQLARYGY
jgi:hypothetical protein